MTPTWIWTLRSEKYPLYAEYVPPEAHSLVCFALQEAVPRYKVVKIRSAPNDRKLNLNT